VPRYNDSRLRLCKRCAHRARRSNDEERETYGDTFTDVHRPIASAATRAFNIKPAIGGGLKKRRKEEQTPDICLPSCSRMRKFSFNAIACPFPSNYAPAWLWAARPEIISLDSRARSSSRRAFLLPAWMLNPKLNFRSNHDPASKFQSLNKLSIFRDVCLFRAGFNSFGVRGSGGRIHRDPPYGWETKRERACITRVLQDRKSSRASSIEIGAGRCGGRAAFKTSAGIKANCHRVFRARAT